MFGRLGRIAFQEFHLVVFSKLELEIEMLVFRA